jgi:hypothetical protein
MSYYDYIHRNVARIDIDEELQGEVGRLIERVDHQVKQRAQSHSTTTSNTNRPPLILKDIDDGDDAQK